MKKYLFLFLILSNFLITGCNSPQNKDETPTKISSSIKNLNELNSFTVKQSLEHTTALLNFQDTKISAIEIDELKPQKYYTYPDYNVYLVGLTEVNVTKNNETKTLKEYLIDKEYLNNLIKSMTIYTTLFDGGTTWNKPDANSNIFTYDIQIFKCQTTTGNKDIYIGSKDSKFKANYCKENNSTFIKTFRIIDITENNAPQYDQNGNLTSYGNSYKVTLKGNNTPEKTVIINNIHNKIHSFHFVQDTHRN